LSKSETFYSTFYGFKSSPFHVTPDPGNLLLTAAHKHAIGAIYYGIVARKGFVVVTGDVGVGKTSVLRASLDRLDTTSAKFVYLFNPRVTSAELYHAIVANLGYRLRERQNALAALQYLLLKFYNSGVNIILAIDEAQNMPEETLEDLRVLSNIETRSDKLLQIVLVGQPELDAMLTKPSLRQLQQRIAVRAMIPALSVRQSFRYVRHRVAAAGRTEDKPLFSFAALWYIAYAARGNPRRLNIYCDNALINGLGHRAERITFAIAREALHQFKQSPRPQSWGLPWIVAAVMVVVLSAVVGAALWSSVQAPFEASSIRQIVRAFAGAPAVRPAASLPTMKQPATPPTHPPRVESVAHDTSGASAAGDDQPAARSPSDATAARDGFTESPTDSAPATTKPLQPVAAPEPASTGMTVRPEDTPGLRRDAELAVVVRPDGKLGVIVRPGDSLLKLCLSVYGKCGSGTLQRVLEINPQIHSANVIVSGQTVVFQPPRQPGSGSEND
jgi:type II secretory pathway predicted ATPase ExeA